eukprot:gnl/MRDRNA2_/MRDRNA2_78745_c0_seq2.p1 gnl/MRDRNA2_/MRDRNA2_78745_c0~~gnl/MRDRNA2_/MRDRNA2_78745_c0_seq2.p1  ORF type:complete len:478 (-),score=95.00 gnl/MRDRNA2_/MRDRNA2_78745_c0_seq2:14-1447(-)
MTSLVKLPPFVVLIVLICLAIFTLSMMWCIQQVSEHERIVHAELHQVQLRLEHFMTSDLELEQKFHAELEITNHRFQDLSENMNKQNEKIAKLEAVIQQMDPFYQPGNQAQMMKQNVVMKRWEQTERWEQTGMQNPHQPEDGLLWVNAHGQTTHGEEPLKVAVQQMDLVLEPQGQPQMIQENAFEKQTEMPKTHKSTDSYMRTGATLQTAEKPVKAAVQHMDTFLQPQRQAQVLVGDRKEQAETQKLYKPEGGYVWEEEAKGKTICPVGDRRGLFQPGEIDDMFTMLLTSEEVQQFHPTALSRDPWILQFDNFLTPEQCELLIADTEGKFDTDITHDIESLEANLNYRNSSSFVCFASDCAEHSEVQKLRDHMAAVLRAGTQHGHGLSVLRYQRGGFYNMHHDYILKEWSPKEWEFLGPRVFTCMVYLSNVNQGGETDFFHLGLKIKPKKGRALLWPNVISENPVLKDERTAHQALI